ncbi:hypothetical protein MUU53_20095 [Rhizobium lemnae]|uniref:Uncharacterized protein n=1 Tax=Rhizobium lemnae TaxID=1214924 RepID=A0ABV8E5J5_9HYPH|nr:hypothetical protein [Rhizobium lemnae]MCJ8510196.1 hypothetical protein [Rhizobium lemnae]
MSKVISFRRQHDSDESDLSSVRVSASESLTGYTALDSSSDEKVDHHWGIALALATWPICLGAGAVLMALD